MSDIRVTLDDGKLKLDLGDALGALTTLQKVEIALHLAVSADVFSAVVDQLIDDYTDPLKTGYWHCGHGAINAQRARVLAKMDAIRMEAVKHFMTEARRAKDEAERERAHAWRLVREWPRDSDGRPYKPLPDGPPWQSSPWPTEAEAVAALAAEDAK